MDDFRTSTRGALLAGCALLIATPALAQTATGAGAQTAPADTAASPNPAEDIVVTGTSEKRSALSTPMSVTSMTGDELARIPASSQANILNTVPSIKAEGGGGEVAVNVFVKGLPLGGTYQLTPLEYDGIPVLSAFGLNSSAYDVYFRNDLGIERLEFVSGGVSNLFGPGSVAGLINYISKTGTDTPHGTIAVEGATRGRVRGDVALSGPLDRDNGFYYAVSGYYRYDDGPLRTGLPTEGGQIRGNLKKEWADGTGSVTLYGQYINDRVQFYLPVPLDGNSRTRIDGNDGKTVYSLNTDAVSDLGFNTPRGPFQTDIERGVMTKGGMLALAFDQDFGGGWGINGRVKYSEYKHQFGFFLDGDGIVNRPESQAQFLSNRGYTGTGSFTTANGTALPSNALLFANRFQDRIRPVHDWTYELNLTKRATTGAFTHHVTLGAFAANAIATDNTVTTTYLGTFNERPELVNVVVQNANGTTIVSNKGLVDAGVGYTNNRHRAKRYALYLADQIESDRWVIDFGGRIEKTDGYLKREIPALSITDTTTPNLSTALRNVVWGTGRYQVGHVSTDSWALAGGVLYKATPTLSLYANASRGYFFPALNTVSFNAQGNPQSYQPEVIHQAETGVKYAGGRFSGSLAVFYNNLKNRRTVTFLNNSQGQLYEFVNVVSTEAYGVEGVIGMRLFDHLRFDGNVSYIHGRYTKLDALPAFVGNEEPRQPSFLYNAGLYYDDHVFDASFSTTYTGPNYTDPSNAIRLDGFNVEQLVVGYTLPIARGRFRVSGDVWNVFNDQGITEGSPRQATQTLGAYFIGRPILPRRFTAKLTYSF
jgi:iron complex outermembrane recepter protein